MTQGINEYVPRADESCGCLESETHLDLSHSLSGSSRIFQLLKSKAVPALLER